jgi:chromosome segregation ATPase
VCVKKYVSGFVRIGALSLLLLALALVQLSAIPPSLTGGEKELQISQLKVEIAEKEAEIESMTVYIQQLEIQLNELIATSEKFKGINSELENYVMSLKSQLETLMLNLSLRESEVTDLKNSYAELEIRLMELVEASTESDGSEVLKALTKQLNLQVAQLTENLSNSEAEVRSLTANLASLETLSGLSKESFQELMGQYLPLKEQYDLVVQERDKYYQEAVNAKADNDGFNGMIGADGILFDNGDFGAGVKLGAGWGDLMLTLGVDYRLDAPIVFDVTKFTYRLGVQYKF